MHHEEEKKLHEEECCCHHHDHDEHDHEEHCCCHDHDDHEHEEHCCCRDHEEHEHEEHCCCHDHEHHGHEECHCHEHEHSHSHGHKHSHGCECCHIEGEEEEELDKKGLIILVSRIVVSLVLILLGSIWFTEGKCQELIGSSVGQGINHIIMFAAWLVVAYDVAWKAMKALVKGHNPFNEFLLMTLASLGAFALRFFGENEFMEGALVMLLYQIGEVFSDIAADKSRDAITKAIDLREESASVETENGLITKTPEELEIGDVVIVKVGEKILCDGYVYEGFGSVDESSLTGESIPVDKVVESEVMSGTILRTGSIKVKVSKLYADSTVAKMLELVEESSEKKSKSERFITRFAKIYTPIVFGLAALVAIVPPLFLGIGDGNIWARWIYTALCFLVISCPCAVVISVPLAFFSGLGLASKHGIIVKGAEYFDKLKKLKYVAFDKTGTLTKGCMAIVETSPKGIEENQLIEYLAAAETRSTHPIAKAICAKANNPLIANDVSFYEEVAGYGVKAIYKGHDLMAGKAKLLTEAGLSVDEANSIGTVVYLAVDGVYAGYVVLEDEVRAEVPALMKGLKEEGIVAILVSGDKKATVTATAEKLGIVESYGECLPGDKATILKDKINSGEGAVAFVGDGINDAPSIVMADVGFAMGGMGSDMAIANADVVLMNDDPSKVVTAVKVAKKTERRATFNIVAALTIKLAVMILSLVFGSSFPLWAAVLADTGTSLLLVLSSLLLSYSKVD